MKIQTYFKSANIKLSANLLTLVLEKIIGVI